MRKKLLIVICAMLMLFGSALSVSAEETTTETEETTNVVKPIQYVKLKNDSYVDYNDESLSIWWSIRIDELLDEPMYICLIKNENYSSEYESVYDGFIYSYESESFSDAGNLFHGTTYQYCKTPDVDWYLNSTNIKANLYNSIYEKEYDSGTVTYRVTEWNTNVPMFDSQEDAEKYYKTGDPFWMLNDYYDNMETDETFGLTGFTADNTITASWTGTSHDDVIDTYNQADVGIRPGYAYKSAPGQIAVRGMVIEEYEIADKTFTKLYDELTHSDDTLFLRYLEVIPTYQKESLGDVYKGKSCWIWFDEDGNVEKIENEFEHGGDGSSDTEYNSDFYLVKVKGFAETISEWLNDPTYVIQWRGTSMDDELLSENYEPDDTSVLVYCIGVSDSGVKEQYDYFVLDPYIDELTIWQKLGMITNTANEFEINLDAIEANMLKDGLTFEGEFYLIPQYKKDSRQYVRGCKTSVNIFTGEVNNIIEEPDEDDVIVPITPPSEDDDEEDDDDSGLPDIGGISDIPTFMLGLIKSFFGFVGYVPNLLAVIFPFLPTEVNYLLSIGLVVSVILRIVGR